MNKEQITNAAIRCEIDAVCNDLLMETVDEYINAPVILALFLGQETYDVVSASLKDAFTTSFKIEPHVFEICLSDTEIGSGKITEQVVDAIRFLYEQGKDYSDLRIAVIGLMDDPFFSADSPEMADCIGESLVQLGNYGVGVTKTAFYGLFRQSRMNGTNYQYAFDFVKRGKEIWKNIYHIEIAIFARDVHLYTQLIAVNIISDSYTMVQQAGEDYHWKSLYLHYLKVPELIITRTLREIYAAQVSGRNLDYEKWGKGIREELNRMLDGLYDRPEYDCEQYIPLCYCESPEKDGVEKKKGFLRRTRGTEPTTFGRVILNPGSFESLLNELYGKVRLDEEYDQIIEAIVSSATSVDQDTGKIARFILDTLDSLVDEYGMRLDNLKARVRQEDGISVGHTSDYLKQAYQTEKKLYLLRKKTEIIQELTRRISSGSTLSRVIREVIRKNREYTNVLDELSKNEYGGNLEHFAVSSLPEFKVNQPAGEILKELDKEMLRGIIGDKDIVHQKLRTFLAGVSTTVANKHNLGEINGIYNRIEPVTSVLLMTPSLGLDPEIVAMTGGTGAMYIRTGDLYRENTFYIISGREYLSDQYIVRYKRG